MALQCARNCLLYIVIGRFYFNKMSKKLKINSFVIFDEKSCSKEDYEQYYKSTFPSGKLFVYLGEIKQASGHCILCDLDSGKIIGIYHIGNFREASDGEC